MGNRIALGDTVWDRVAEEGHLPGSSTSRHRSRTRRPNAGTSSSLTSRSPLDHTIPHPRTPADVYGI